MLQIYVQDLGWAGSIVVIAESEVEARDMMKNEHNYEKSVELVVLPIQKGLVYANLGDL